MRVHTLDQTQLADDIKMEVVYWYTTEILVFKGMESF